MFKVFDYIILQIFEKKQCIKFYTTYVNVYIFLQNNISYMYWKLSFDNA